MRLTTRKSDVLYHYLFFFLPFLLQYFRLFCQTLNSTLVYFPQILPFSDFPHVFFHPELSGLCGISVNLCVTLCALTQCLWFKLLVFTEPKRDQQLQTTDLDIRRKITTCVFFASVMLSFFEIWYEVTTSNSFSLAFSFLQILCTLHLSTPQLVTTSIVLYQCCHSSRHHSVAVDDPTEMLQAGGRRGRVSLSNWITHAALSVLCQPSMAKP